MPVATMNWCEELIVRTDIGRSTHPDHKNIAMMECKAEQEGRLCHRRGLCVEARHADTWKRIDKTAFSKN